MLRVVANYNRAHEPAYHTISRFLRPSPVRGQRESLRTQAPREKLPPLAVLRRQRAPRSSTRRCRLALSGASGEALGNLSSPSRRRAAAAPSRIARPTPGSTLLSSFTPRPRPPTQTAPPAPSTDGSPASRAGRRMRIALRDAEKPANVCAGGKTSVADAT
ncbi:hypothetical protein PsYK624_099330 [Phanerochaete sordida]|uniref:Uncharacterized protein n=1 Tax=Phanerochaete sordida TaxID=48140 RepID=A0A9P3GDN6_9APHY|nr:hypothetical protein PsYK624_099330 [Phanerochaete sordida]